jgi:hypothetical protein
VGGSSEKKRGLHEERQHLVGQIGKPKRRKRNEKQCEIKSRIMAGIDGMIRKSCYKLEPIEKTVDANGGADARYPGDVLLRDEMRGTTATLMRTAPLVPGVCVGIQDCSAGWCANCAFGSPGSKLCGA